MQRKIVAIAGVAVLAIFLGACDQATTVTTEPTAETVAPAAAVVPAAIPATPEPPATGGTPIAHEVGFAWLVPTTVDPGVRKLDVYENGTKLGGAEALHEEIRKIGKGLYSHWKSGEDSKIYFSTSDNSDPNTNGRAYEFK